MSVGPLAMNRCARLPQTSSPFGCRRLHMHARPLARMARAQAASTEESSLAQPEQAAAQKELQTERAIEAQDAAPQGALVADNLQASQEAAQFQIFGLTQEAVNGRAAMLGFVAAVIAEVTTGQSVWSQIAGKYVDGDLVEKPIGTSTLFFGAIIVLLTYASIAPQFQAGEKPDARTFGPFTPFRERWVGRVAQLGFAGLLIVELLKGNNPVF